MKSSFLLAALATSGALATPHGHSHQRLSHTHGHEKREIKEEIVTVTVCKLGVVELPESVCEFYVNKGVLKYVDDGTGAPAVALAKPETSKPAVAPSPKPAVASPPQVEAVPQSVMRPALNTPSAINKASTPVSLSDAALNVDVPFVDGTVPCDTPPSQFGADNVVVRYLGGKGWLNQQVAVDESYRNEKGCGGFGRSYCQYVCPGTDLPTQWPKFYQRNGVSVGGLLCENNLLYRSNTDFDTLCMPSSDVMTVTVKNTLDEPVAICKTNYPGDEAMTIPYVVPAGGSRDLPVIPMEKYWHTRSGDPTSAQFYINNKGVPVEQACIWGNGNPLIRAGNAAPMNLGGGASTNEGYWSMFSNKPTQPNALLDFNIKMSGSGITPSIGCEYDGRAGVVTFNGQDISTMNTAGAAGCTIRAGQGGHLEYLLY